MQNIPRLLNRVKLSANSFCRTPQTLCHFPISWRCHGIPYHLMSLPLPPISTLLQCETINEISSCRASLGKTNQSATAAGERCKIAWQKSKSKFIEKNVKHAPHDVHAPVALPLFHCPSVCVERQKLRRQMQITSKFFLALASSAFCGETLKANYLTCDIMREWIPWRLWNWQIDPFAFQTMAKGVLLL